MSDEVRLDCLQNLIEVFRPAHDMCREASLLYGGCESCGLMLATGQPLTPAFFKKERELSLYLPYAPPYKGGEMTGAMRSCGYHD